MFGSHRRDLKEAHERHVAALEKLAIVLSDQVDWLRWQLSEKPHVGPNLFPAEPVEEAGPLPEKKYLSEEEEDILALHLNDYLSDSDLKELEGQLGHALNVTQLHQLEPDE